MINLLLIISVIYLLVDRITINKRIDKIEQTLSNDVFIELAKGNKRMWRGYWKIHPNDYEKIALDPRSHQTIADEYKISRSRIGQIKHDYYKKREEDGKKIVGEYFRNKDNQSLFDPSKEVKKGA